MSLLKEKICSLLRKQSHRMVHLVAFDHITNIKYTYTNHSSGSAEVLRVLMDDDKQYVAEPNSLYCNQSKFCYYIRQTNPPLRYQLIHLSLQYFEPLWAYIQLTNPLSKFGEENTQTSYRYSHPQLCPSVAWYYFDCYVSWRSANGFV